jgi:8-oxo-dGTP diphosphatase
MYKTEYIPPTVTVDSVIFQIINSVLNVCLVQRSKDPFKKKWALPGGYCSAGETTTEALERIVKFKAGISIAKQAKHTEQLYTFDNVARDPRGHAVSITYMSCGLNIMPVKAREATQFFPINELPELAFDHKSNIQYAHKRLSSKISYTNVIYSLLPEKFTLTELQSAYEAIFEREVDKRNFRKKFTQLDLIKETDEFKRDGAHRPARLYCFKTQKLQTLERSFD